MGTVSGPRHRDCRRTVHRHRSGVHDSNISMIIAFFCGRVTVALARCAYRGFVVECKLSSGA